MQEVFVLAVVHRVAPFHDLGQLLQELLARGDRRGGVAGEVDAAEHVLHELRGLVGQDGFADPGGVDRDRVADLGVQPHHAGLLDLVGVDDGPALHGGQMDRVPAPAPQFLQVRVSDVGQVELVQGEIGQSGQAVAHAVATVLSSSCQSALREGLQGAQGRGAVDVEVRADLTGRAGLDTDVLEDLDGPLNAL